MLYLFKTPPSYFKKSSTYLILYLSITPHYYFKKCCFYHQGAHKITKFCTYSKYLHASKNAVPNFVFIPNAPLLLQKKRSAGYIYQRPCLEGLELICFFQSGQVSGIPPSFNSTQFIYICLFIY